MQPRWPWLVIGCACRPRVAAGQTLSSQRATVTVQRPDAEQPRRRRCPQTPPKNSGTASRHAGFRPRLGAPSTCAGQCGPRTSQTGQRSGAVPEPPERGYCADLHLLHPSSLRCLLHKAIALKTATGTLCLQIQGHGQRSRGRDQDLG